jgi:quercetin dioxygenase-like cupin family protein
MEHIRRIDRDLLMSGGKANYLLAGPAAGDPLVQISTSVVPPRHVGFELHTHVFDHYYYIVEGQLEVEIDGQVATAHPGDLVAFPKGSRHRHWNETDRTEIHIAIMVPPPAAGAPAATPVRPTALPSP